MSVVYRVENKATNIGLWYDTDGNYNPFILKLSAAKCRDLPMGYDPDLASGKWVSAGETVPEMQQWFSFQDLTELQHAGYKLFEYEVTDYRRVPGHVVFTRPSVISSRELPIEVLR